MDLLKATALFEGMVQGVVVHITISEPFKSPSAILNLTQKVVLRYGMVQHSTGISLI